MCKAILRSDYAGGGHCTHHFGGTVQPKLASIYWYTSLKVTANLSLIHASVAHLVCVLLSHMASYNHYYGGSLIKINVPKFTLAKY